MTGTEQHPPLLVLTDAQRERLTQWRAWWEEGEQRFAHWELEDRDRETAEAFRALLDDAGFADGTDLTAAQLDRLCALARRLAPNSSLDRRLYRETADRAAFNRALRGLLFGGAALPERIAAFLALRGVGAQTASQLLCASEPDRFPLVSTSHRSSAAALEALDITAEQRKAAQDTADAEYGIADRSPRDPARRLLGDFALLAAVRAACAVERDTSYLALHRLLQLAPGVLPVGQAARAPWPAVGRAAHAAYAVREERVAYQPLRSSQSAARMELPEAEGDERALLAALEAFVGARGFTYPSLLLRDYYVALKTRRFAILSGVSGTGKTRLTRLFAEFFAGSGAPRYLLLPVRPDWTDPTPLLGYFNLLASPEGRYVSTPFLDFLRRASSNNEADNARRAWFVCLDEMNLGRVEHYFADVLAALETPDRAVPLHGAPDGAMLRLSPNVFITGTVNVDEASHALSRRVLDRANTLTLGEVDLGAFGAVPSAGGAADAADAADAAEASAFEALFLRSRVRDVAEARARLDALDPGLVPQAVRLLTAVNDALAESGLNFGYRVRDEALMYLANSFDADGAGLLSEDPEDLAANAAIALDLQVAQRALPRLSGTEEQIGGAVRALLALLAPDPPRERDSYARRAGRSRYPRSAERLLRLAARLRREGYATFYEA